MHHFVPPSCASFSQPHGNLLRVVPQKAIIIKDVKTAPAPGLPRTGAILISRSRLIHGLFLYGFGHFFHGSGSLVRVSRKWLIGFRIGAELISGSRSPGGRAWECTSHIARVHRYSPHTR